MSQNGPYPGPHSRPWSDDDSDEPYTAPSDPWGDQHTPAAGGAAWGGYPTSMPPSLDSSAGYPQESSVGYPQASSPGHPQESSAGYPQAYGAEALSGASPVWGSPPPPPPRRRNLPIVALVAVLGLLILGGLGTTAWLLMKKDDPATRTGGGLPSVQPTTAANAVEPQPSEDARFVKKGECVTNQGTAQNPSMTIVPCTTGTYEVLKRIDGRTTGEADAESKCSKVPHYTKWYFYDSELDSLDFVLCLRESK